MRIEERKAVQGNTEPDKSEEHTEEPPEPDKSEGVASTVEPPEPDKFEPAESTEEQPEPDNLVQPMGALGR